MYKIKVIDLDLAKRHGVTFEDETDKIWANIDIAQYVTMDEATTFLDAEEANQVLCEWEAIVNID